MKRISVESLWQNAEASMALPYINKFDMPFEALSHIAKMIADISKGLNTDEYNVISDGVWVAKSARIAPTATIIGPCIIGEDTEIRPGAFIRGNVIVGKKAVVGNSTELKNCILFDGVQVPHFNYVGDSILGYKAHMGAGAVTSNVKSDKTLVTIKLDGEKIETGRKKFGALLGDFVEVGCNSVLNPGTVIGKDTNVYPLSSVRGYVPENSIYKSENNIVEKVR